MILMGTFQLSIFCDSINLREDEDGGMEQAHVKYISEQSCPRELKLSLLQGQKAITQLCTLGQLLSFPVLLQCFQAIRKTETRWTTVHTRHGRRSINLPSVSKLSG